MGCREPAGGDDDAGGAVDLFEQLIVNQQAAVFGGEDVGASAGGGPQFTTGFAEAQRRLLGPGLVCADGAPGSESQLSDTALLVETLLQRLLDDAAWRDTLRRIGLERIGSGGGGARMSADLHALLEQRRHG